MYVISGPHPPRAGPGWVVAAVWTLLQSPVVVVGSWPSDWGAREKLGACLSQSLSSQMGRLRPRRTAIHLATHDHSAVRLRPPHGHPLVWQTPSFHCLMGSPCPPHMDCILSGDAAGDPPVPTAVSGPLSKEASPAA